MAINLEELGITKDDLIERVVESATATLLSGHTFDEDGEEVQCDSWLRRELDKSIKTIIDASVQRIAEENVKPVVEAKVDSLVIQDTNSYGEKKGEPMTFVEYLVRRAEQWMTEEVDYDGYSKAEKGRDSYNWRAHKTRCAQIIDKRIEYGVKHAMELAVTNANGTLVAGLAKTAELKLREIADALAVTVKVK